MEVVTNAVTTSTVWVLIGPIVAEVMPDNFKLGLIYLWIFILRTRMILQCNSMTARIM